MGEKMTPRQLEEEIIDFLRQHKSGSLATCMGNIPRSSPVLYFLGRQMDIYILSAGGEKFRAIAENPNICLLVNTEYINFRRIKGVQVFGRAITSQQDDRILKEAMKYTPNNEALQFKNQNINAIKIFPEEIVYLDSIVDGDRTKQILRNREVEIQSEDILLMH